MKSPAPPESILLIRPSALGDVCRSVPVAASLRAAWPNATLTWMVQDSFVAAVGAHPAVDRVLPFPRRALAGAWRSPRAARALFRYVRELRAGRFDLVLDCQGLARSGFLALATGARARVGFADAREFGWLGVSRRVRTDARHAVPRMLALVDALGVEPIEDMRLYVSDTDRAAWNASGKRPAGGYVVFAPTARWLTKRWPAERWGELAAGLVGEGVDTIVIVGAANERPDVVRVVNEIALRAADRLRIVDIAGQTDVGQLMAVIDAADLVVANDSAALHMAVGFDRPLVGIFGPTDPAEVGPWRRDAFVVRSPDARGAGHDYRDLALGDSLMRLVSADSVLDVARRALAAEAFDRMADAPTFERLDAPDPIDPGAVA